jgi:nonsense-mediated mRNA decay protein 3
VPHKRTFLYLEQLILKHNAHRDTISIQEKKDGLDFYYVQRSHAVKMCEFLASVVPVRTQSSSAVVSMDIHTSTVNNKFSYSVEIAPVCKDDLVCLPKSLARQMSQMPQLVLCQRINNALRFIDPNSLQIADLPADKYWREPFGTLCAIPELIEFLVLDIEPTGAVTGNGRWVAADAQVSPMNATSFGQADAVYHTRTHLGALLQPGDTVLGYNLRNANFNNAIWDSLDHGRTPDIVLVRKSYPDSKKRRRGRNWKLKSIAKEAGDDVEKEGTGRGALGRKGGLDGKNVERDYEMFLRELEEDEEMRAGVNLYRDPAAEARAQRRREEKALARARKAAGLDADGNVPGQDGMEVDGEAEQPDFDDGRTDDGFTTDGESEFGDDDIPRVRLEELLDEFEDSELHSLVVPPMLR